jgi:hypothetical protein
MSIRHSAFGDSFAKMIAKRWGGGRGEFTRRGRQSVVCLLSRPFSENGPPGAAAVSRTASRGFAHRRNINRARRFAETETSICGERLVVLIRIAGETPKTIRTDNALAHATPRN